MADNNNNYNNIQQLAVNEKQITLDEWLIDLLRNKLQKMSIAVGKTGKPFVLYRNTIEEANSFVEEEVSTVNEKYAIGTGIYSWRVYSAHLSSTICIYH